MLTLLIDDTRNMTADFIARNYWDGIEALGSLGPFDLLLLDHDIASFRNGEEFTGYNIVRWLEENPQFWPQNIQVITMNPTGRCNIESILMKYYYKDGVTWRKIP